MARIGGIDGKRLLGGNGFGHRLHARSRNSGGVSTERRGDRLACDLRPRPLTRMPAVVLDPFAGSGTVGMVANRLSRRAILIDLNPEYLEQQMKRNAQTPLGLGAA